MRTALFVLLAATAQAQTVRDPYGGAPPQPRNPYDQPQQQPRNPYDQNQQPPPYPQPPPAYQPYEPTPNEQPQPPLIYVPVPPPIVAPTPYAPEPYMQPPPKKGGFVFRVDLGGAYRYALKDSFGAAALRLVLGGEGRHVGFGGLFDIELGGSKAGLFYAVLDTGFLIWGVLGENVRLGFGPTLGFMAIQRATNSDPFEDLRAVMVGLNLELTIDLIKSRRSALYLLGRVRYDYLDTGGNSGYANGATLLVGLGARL
jgi:hypothetical protein